MPNTALESGARRSYMLTHPEAPIKQYAGPPERWNTYYMNGVGLNLDTLSKIEPLVSPLKDVLSLGPSSDQFYHRARLFGSAQVDTLALLFINSQLFGLSERGENRFVFLRSQDRERTKGVPLLTEEDKATFLANKVWQYGKRFKTKESAEPLRTVTLSFKDPKGHNRVVLASSVGSGDFITDEIKDDLAHNLWGPPSRNQLKNACV